MYSIIKKAIAVLTAGIIATSGFASTGFAASASPEELTSSFSVEYAGAVSKPSYSIKGSLGSRRIKLTCKTPGAVIYYTTNGSTPTTSSKKYTGLIKITGKTTIKAIAVSGSTKSAVMTKTVKVATLVGDVTGDGKINNNDYTRLKKYLDGETSYICKDNADTSGDGTIKNKDLSLLAKYLNEEITSFPNSSSSSSSSQSTGSVTTPSSSVYRVDNGKKVALTCSDSSAVIYYTLDGSKPTNSSYKYNQALIFSEDATIRYIAYKNGTYSKSRTKNLTVDECSSVNADMATGKDYTEQIDVKLTCSTTSSKIYYTTDGSDPKVKGILYTGAITVTENTTIKAYARSKGYADGDIMSFKYNVKIAGYSISGTVWDDTANESSTADGIRQNNEVGLNGITVYLMNVSTSLYEKTTITSTINGIAGSYKFDNVSSGTNYKVVFMYNGQKYRSYDYIVPNGNQAVSPEVPALSISRLGSSLSASNTLTSTINNYKDATAYSGFDCYATTNAVYSRETTNVNLALKSNVFGKLSLSLVPTALESALTGSTVYLSNTAGQTAANGDTLIYVLTLTNDSPTQTLNDAAVMLYLDSDISIQNITSSNNRLTYNYNGVSGAYNTYLLKDFVGTLEPSKSINLTITAYVNTNTAFAATISNSAEVIMYRYASSCYDAYSIPGNMTVGTKKENDEAISVPIGIGSTSSAKTIAWQTTPQFNAMIAGSTPSYAVVIIGNSERGSGDVFVSSSNPACATCTVLNYMFIGSDAYVTIAITPKAVGKSNISVVLADGTNKSVSTTVSVIR